MTMMSKTNKNICILTTALIATAAFTTVDATTTLLRGLQRQHNVVLDEDGIDEVGEQVQHYPPSNWDGMSTPSRRELMRTRALDASFQHFVDDSEDPNPDAGVMGRLIEDENDMGLFDWEMMVDATATTVEEKVYEPPSDAITVSLYCALSKQLGVFLVQLFFFTTVSSQPFSCSNLSSNTARGYPSTRWW